MSFFKQLTLNDLRKLNAESSSSTSALDRIPTRFVKLLLASYLSVLMNLMISYLVNGVFPQALKTAVVKPYIKKFILDCEYLANYPPISNLSFNSKLLDRAVLKQPSDHPDDNKFLCKFQSAY